ncbi:MAG TPA: pirin family protein [Sphingomonadales bacterium]|nr:pirin family protein [Sphingomonadales bacterium]
MIPSRKIVKISPGLAASDGAGVKLTRYIGAPDIDMLDPFLLLDRFASDNPDDYLGGFPEHPHRGFETVTYILAGRMRHKDNVGHEGVINPGDVQWMTAGRGIIHSEMPEQTDGLLEGFQLWVNLAAQDKMTAPAYHEYPAAAIPEENHDQNVTVKVISGQTDHGTKGAVTAASDNPLFLDVTLKAGGSFHQSIPADHNGFIMVIDGVVQADGAGPELGARELGILGDGDYVILTSKGGDSRFLVIAGRLLNEPVARSGPFVMNTKDQVMQAYQDYRTGKF